MAQQRSHKKIVYLDQNWLSDMTKARLDGYAGVDKNYFTELFKVIQKALSEDKIVIPTSRLHESESSLSSQLYADLKSTDNALSRGLSFNSSVDIFDNQLLEAASQFAGIEQSLKPWWQIPFNRDPDFPDAELPVAKSPVDVYVTFPDFVERHRNVRNNVTAPIYRQYKEGESEHNIPYIDEVRRNMIQLFREHYYAYEDMGPVVIQKYSQEKVEVDPNIQELINQRQGRLWQLALICYKKANLAAFLDSSDFMKSPFLSIHARLMAGDIVYHGSRWPESSLLDDFDMAATVIPYVDMFATENYLAELLRQTGVTNDYGCTVYTMRKKDKFLDYLSQL